MKKLKTGEYQNYWRIVFVVVLFVLLYFTLIPQPPKPIELSNIDKVYHLIAFASFSFIFKLAFVDLTGKTIVISSTLLGIAIEFAQYFIPGRGFSIADMVADFTGVVIGLLIAEILTKQSLSINEEKKL